LTTYLKLSNIKESSSDVTDKEMVTNLLDDHGTIIKQMRKTTEVADANGDEGTVDLIGAYIRELEKTSWMLDAWSMKLGEKRNA
jgi:starvation-inducible DNA-binding protein